MATAIDGARLEARQDFGSEASNIGDICDLGGEGIIERRRDPRAQVVDDDIESCWHTLQRRLLVVLGEGHLNGGRIADLRANELRLESRNESVGANHDRHALGRCAVDCKAAVNAIAIEGDDRVVAHLRATIGDWGQRCVAVAQVVDDRFDLRLVRLFERWLKGVAAIVAELDLRRHWDHCGEGVGLTFDDRLRIDLWAGKRNDVGLHDRVAIAALDQDLGRLVENAVDAGEALNDGAWRLPWAEAWDAVMTRHMADRLGNCRGHVCDLEGDLESDGALLGWSGREFHERTGYPTTLVLVGEVRLELTRRCRHRLLRPARLPFRHSPPSIIVACGGSVHRRSSIDQRINHRASAALGRRRHYPADKGASGPTARALGSARA